MCCCSFAMINCGGGDDGFIPDDNTSSSGNATNGGTSGDNGTSSEDKKTTELSIDARPTDWVRTGNENDYTPGVSVSFVIAKPDLSIYATPSMAEDSKGDLMALFVNGTCRGTSLLFPTDNVFMPTAVSLEGIDNPDENKLITIRYYSARLHHIFTSKTKYYLKNKSESFGTRTTPVKLEWE